MSTGFCPPEPFCQVIRLLEVWCGACAKAGTSGSVSVLGCPLQSYLWNHNLPSHRSWHPPLSTISSVPFENRTHVLWFRVVTSTASRNLRLFAKSVLFCLHDEIFTEQAGASKNSKDYHPNKSPHDTDGRRGAYQPDGCWTGTGMPDRPPRPRFRV